MVWHVEVLGISAVFPVQGSRCCLAGRGTTRSACTGRPSRASLPSKPLYSRAPTVGLQGEPVRAILGSPWRIDGSKTLTNRLESLRSDGLRLRTGEAAL